MAMLAKEKGLPFPYLYDRPRKWPRRIRLRAHRTSSCSTRPTGCVRGQMDDSRPGNGVPVTGQDLRAAIDALLAGPVPVY